MINAEDVRAAASGRWESILLDLGVPDYILNRKNQPCPGCEGSDRFQFTNYKGDGMYNCRGCGAGNGFNLLYLVRGWEFPEALKRVAACIGVSTLDKWKEPNTNKRRDFIKSAMKPLNGNDPASLYLKSRKIYSKSFSNIDMGFIASQKYYTDGKPDGDYPVLVSAIRSNTGELITYQIIYLTTEGKKAPVSNCKKVISKFNGVSCGVYVFGFSKMNKDEIGVTEGVEDCISASIKYRIPVIGLIGTSAIESFEPPLKALYLTSFIQNDKGFQGQAASFKMLKNLAHKTQIKLDWVMSEKLDFNEDLLSAV